MTGPGGHRQIDAAGSVPEQQRTGWALVASAQAGDTAAFGELYRRHLPGLHRYATGRVTDPGLVEDLVQDTFLRAWRGLGGVRESTSDVGAWLVTILRNRILDHHRSGWARREVVGLPASDRAAVDDPARSAVAAVDAGRVLRGPVAALTDHDRACLVERHVHGLVPARTRGVRGAGAAKAATARALRRLRTELAATDPATHAGGGDGRDSTAEAVRRAHDAAVAASPGRAEAEVGAERVRAERLASWHAADDGADHAVDAESAVAREW